MSGFIRRIKLPEKTDDAVCGAWLCCGAKMQNSGNTKTTYFSTDIEELRIKPPTNLVLQDIVVGGSELVIAERGASRHHLVRHHAEGPVVTVRLQSA